MKNQIIALRKELGLSQAKFAEKLKLSRNFIGLIESGERSISERTINDICRIFNVNNHWLRTGEGEMFKPVNKNLQILEYFNDVAELDDTSFKKKISLALAQLSDEGWQHLEKFLDELNKTDY